MELKYKKIIVFFSGILILMLFGAIWGTVKVSFFDCRNGQCLIKECIEIDQECEQDNYDARTGEEIRNCCSDYEIRTVPFRNYLLEQVRFYSIICGGGLGIFLGVLLLDRISRNKK